MHAYETQTLVDKLNELPPERIAEVEDFIDFLRQRRFVAKRKQPATLDFPVDTVSTWPEGLSLRREDMYGDDGR